MRVDTVPCPNWCIDGWVCADPSNPHAELDETCPVCDGDSVVPEPPERPTMEGNNQMKLTHDTGESIEFRKIWPADAESMLAGVPDMQRNVRPIKVQQYAADMAAGKFNVSHDMIVLTRSGLLLNGQHRLHACVQTDVPFETVVMTVPDDDIAARYAEMDRGAPRGNGDTLKANGYTNVNVIAAIAAGCLRYDLTGTPEFIARSGLVPTTSHQVLDWVQDNPRVEEVANGHNKLVGELRGQSLHSSLKYLWARDIDWDLSMEFWERVTSGDTGFKTGPWWLRDRMLKQAGANTTTPQRIRLAEAIKAFNMFREGSTSGLLRWTDKYAFPSWVTDSESADEPEAGT